MEESNCCYPGCGNSKEDLLHPFPSDKDKCDAWIRAIPKKNFKPSKQSRICGLHFKSKDFIKAEQMFLKPDAIPLNGGNDEHQEKSMECSVQTSPDDCTFNLSFIKDYEDLIHKLDHIKIPSGFHKLEKNGELLIVSFEDRVPKILSTLIIKPDMSFEMWDVTVKLSNDKVSDIVKNTSRITCPLDIENILLYLRIYSECDTEENMVEKCANILEAQDYTEESDRRLIAFIVEQLKLLYKGNSNRRYSKQLLDTCIRWEKRNTAFYRMLIEDDFFILPRTSYLKRIGSNGPNSETDTPQSPQEDMPNLDE